MMYYIVGKIIYHHMITSSDSFSGDMSISSEAIQCPKCRGVMVQGFIVDLTVSKFCRVTNWCEGAPGKPTWFGTNVPVQAEKCIPVCTFRCSICGFLESYAKPEFSAK